MSCSNLRFLVVEDHEFQRRTLMQMLTNLGAEAVHGAEDGHSALQVIRDPDRPVDIVVSDLAMPGMDGMELIRHLSESGAGVSLILASAMEPHLLASVANMAQAYKVKLLGVIGKPPTAVKLAPLINLHISSKPKAHGALDTAFALSEIAEAWTRDEFEPWFAPKVALATAQVRGVQAFPYWRHPVRGMLGPEQFMPSVQAYGLNDDLVWLMLRKCAAHCSTWRAQGLLLDVAVNLAFGSLTDVHLASRVKQIAQKENLEPRHMVLGVTESAVNTDLAKALENLVRLRVDGFGLGVDEFGSGRMSSEQLARIAFTELKISHGFVTGVDRDDTARAGLAVALDLARQLGLVAVADGVSNAAEWDLLREWGCDLGQGDFISPPLAGDQVIPWAAKWQKLHEGGLRA